MKKLEGLLEPIELCVFREFCNVRKIKRDNQLTYCWGEDMKNCQTYKYLQRNKDYINLEI